MRSMSSSSDTLVPNARLTGVGWVTGRRTASAMTAATVPT